MESSDPTANNNNISCTISSESCTSSCTHTPTKKRTEFKKRVNHYLYDNLNRVLCELYFYCEHESNAIQCSEVLNILSQASLQFHQLNRQLIILENANIQNTKSIAWNVSCLSPQKVDFCKFNQNNFKGQNIANVKNILNAQNIANIPNSNGNTTTTTTNNNNKSNTTTNNNKTQNQEENMNDSKQQEMSQENETTKSSNEKANKPKKTKKTIKCWADFDSESDLDFESIKSDDDNSDHHQNEYEQYIKSDIPKNESLHQNKNQNQNQNETETETETEKENQNENEEETPKTQKEILTNHQNESEKQKKAEKEEKEEEQKSEEIEIIHDNKIYKNKHQKWRQKMVENGKKMDNEQNKENINTINNNTNNNMNINNNLSINNNNNNVKDVWFSSYEPVTLNDIMNDQSQNLINKYENNSKSKRNSTTGTTVHNFPLPFNKMVGRMNSDCEKPKEFKFKTNAKIEKLISKLSCVKRNNYRSMNRNEQLKKTQLKQEKAEKRRLQLQEQRHNKWQIVSAKKKQKREKLRKETQHKLLLQKLELNKKLDSAQMRYETKIKERELKAKQHGVKIKNAKKFKDFQLSKKREIQRKSQEEKMKNAQKRYKEKISKKKRNAMCSSKYLKDKEDKEDNRSTVSSHSNHSNHSNQSKNGNKNKKKRNHNHNKNKNNKNNNNKNQSKNNNNNNNNNKIQTSKKKEQNDEIFTIFQSEMNEEKIVICSEEMKETLNVLLLASNEYISNIKLSKNQWIGNCHYSELRVAVQSLSNRIHRLNIKNKEPITYLMSLISTSKSNDERVHECNNSLESSLQNILKLMDNKQVCDASNTYLLMYLIDLLITLITYFNNLSLRTQRLLLQCIVNSTQKNRGIGHYIIRSKSCLYLLDLFYRIMFIDGGQNNNQNNNNNNNNNIISIIHTLLLSIDSIRDYPDLISRKIIFYKYLSIIKFFNKIVCLFSKIKINKNNKETYDLFLRIVPFIQSVTSFNDKQCNLLNEYNLTIIFDVILDTNCYGLHSLISALVLESNKNNSLQSWTKKKPIEILKIILYSFQTINNIARININKFQQIIDKIHLMEIYHVLSYLLQHLTFHHSSNTNNNYIRVLLAQVILFIGYCSFKNDNFQQCLRWGDKLQNNLIYKLCQLPFDYFNKIKEIKILFPTLITCTFQNNANCKVLNTVLNKKHLIRFILKTYHHKYLKKNNNHNQTNTDNNNNKMYELEKRFPIELWPSAIQFYRDE